MTTIDLELGRKGSLDVTTLANAVEAWRRARSNGSVDHIRFVVRGYNDDACLVPEVRTYVQAWAKCIGLTPSDPLWDAWHMPVLGREGYEFLTRCGALPPVSDAAVAVGTRVHEAA